MKNFNTGDSLTTKKLLYTDDVILPLASEAIVSLRKPKEKVLFKFYHKYADGWCIVTNASGQLVIYHTDELQ